eukprot:1012466-Rhodomonas_salina.1
MRVSRCPLPAKGRGCHMPLRGAQRKRRDEVGDGKWEVGSLAAVVAAAAAAAAAAAIGRAVVAVAGVAVA